VDKWLLKLIEVILLGIVSLWSWLESSWVLWVNLTIELNLILVDHVKVVGAVSVDVNEWLLKLIEMILLSIVSLWCWLESGWMLWINLTIELNLILVNHVEVIGAVSVDVDEWLLKLIEVILFSVVSLWSWLESSWVLWVNLCILFLLSKSIRVVSEDKVILIIPVNHSNWIFELIEMVLRGIISLWCWLKSSWMIWVNLTLELNLILVDHVEII
jgi:hypothetical protein